MKALNLAAAAITLSLAANVTMAADPSSPRAARALRNIEAYTCNDIRQHIADIGCRATMTSETEGAIILNITGSDTPKGVSIDKTFRGIHVAALIMDRRNINGSLQSQLRETGTYNLEYIRLKGDAISAVARSADPKMAGAIIRRLGEICQTEGLFKTNCRPIP